MVAFNCKLSAGRTLPLLSGKNQLKILKRVIIITDSCPLMKQSSMIDHQAIDTEILLLGRHPGEKCRENFDELFATS